MLSGNFKYLTVFPGYLFGFFFALPWPWRIKRVLAQLIHYIRSLGITHFQDTVLSFVEGTNERFAMGKSSGVNMSIEELKWVIEDLEQENPSETDLKKLGSLVEKEDFQSMDDESLIEKVDEILSESRRLLENE